MANGIAITVDGSPDADLVNADSIEVLERMGDATQYRLNYSIDILEADFPMLVDDRLNPGVEIAILATTTAGTECLVKGPIYGQDIRLKDGGTGSTLTVMGADNSIKMDREDKITQWADASDSDAATSILTTYGFTPDVEATSSIHLTDKHTLIQRDTDLDFVKRLARRNGYLFWLTCDQLGVETAHFKTAPLGGDTQQDLIINLEAATLEEVKISWDVERPTSVVASQLDLNSLSNIDGGVATSGQTVLGNQNLQSISGDTRSTHVVVPANDSGDLQARGVGLLHESEWFIRAHCATSVAQLKAAVRACQLVNLRGAGSRYSGAYFVSEVRHLIDATSHIMEINLIRNGWL